MYKTVLIYSFGMIKHKLIYITPKKIRNEMELFKLLSTLDDIEPGLTTWIYPEFQQTVSYIFAFQISK